MCKFILSAEGNHEVRLILIVIQSVGVTCITLVAEIQLGICACESVFYSNPGRIVPVQELPPELHSQLSGKIIVALCIYMLVKNCCT